MPNSLNALWSAAMAGVDSFLDSVGRAVMSGERCRKHWRSFADGMPGLRTLRAACGAQSVERSNVQLESCRRCRPAATGAIEYRTHHLSALPSRGRSERRWGHGKEAKKRQRINDLIDALVWMRAKARNRAPTLRHRGSLGSRYPLLALSGLTSLASTDSGVLSGTF
jgi:hypothetical protein